MNTADSHNIRQWYVENNDGQMITTPIIHSATARRHARNDGQRLITINPDGTTSLIYDYGANTSQHSDDTGATYCDECNTWIDGEPISASHSPACSLHPDNIISGPATRCHICHQPAGNNHHISGIIAPHNNPVICDHCWDERLR